MRLPELIEHCHLDKEYLTDDIRKLITRYVKQNHSLDELMRLAGIFLKGIERNHTIPGNIVDSIRGIIVSQRKEYELTLSQEVFVIHNMINYWDQMDLMTRIDLDL